LRGGPVANAFFWRISLAVMLVASTLGVVALSSRYWHPRAIVRGTCAILAFGIVLPTAVTVDRVVRPDPETVAVSQVTLALVRQVGGVRSSASRIMLVGQLGFVAPVFDELNRRGFHVGVSEDMNKAWFGGSHGIKQSQTDQVWFVAANIDVSRLASEPGARIIARSSPLSPSEDDAVRQLQALLYRELVAIGRYDLVAWLNRPTVGGKLARIKGVNVVAARRLATLILKPFELNQWRYALIAFDAAAAPTDYVFQNG